MRNWYLILFLCDTVGKLAAEWKQKQNLTDPKINRDVYLKRIEGLIYGEDPKGGFLENNVFYHPVLKFQFNTPQGWAYQNSPQQVQIAPKDGKAVMIMTLGQGKTVQEAANAVMQQYKLQALESREVTVNGLRALSVVADQQPQQQGQAASVRTLSYFIEYGGNIYHLLGVSSIADFNAYASFFTSSMQSFRQLNDPLKINKKPERVRIKTAAAGTLEQAFRQFRVPDNRHEEMAVLNGMKLSDRLTQGMLIKIIAE